MRSGEWCKWLFTLRLNCFLLKNSEANGLHCVPGRYIVWHRSQLLVVIHIKFIFVRCLPYAYSCNKAARADTAHCIRWRIVFVCLRSKPLDICIFLNHCDYNFLWDYLLSDAIVLIWHRPCHALPFHDYAVRTLEFILYYCGTFCSSYFTIEIPQTHTSCFCYFVLPLVLCGCFHSLASSFVRLFVCLRSHFAHCLSIIRYCSRHSAKRENTQRVVFL